MSMELNHLRIFYEVARRGSFTAAARTLRVSQPALSRSVRLLEASQGIRLLDRGKHGATLTAEGSIFFESCARIFAEVDRLRAVTAKGGGEVRGELALAASDNLCNHLLPRILPGFCRAHPSVRVRLFSGTSEQILRELREQDAEMGLFYTEPKDARAFEWEPLWRVEFVPVSAPSFPTSNLADVGFVGSRQADYAKAYPALAMLRSAGIEPRTVIETNSQETQKQLALAGMGYTLVPRHMVDEELRNGRLRRIKMGRTFEGRAFLVRKRGRAWSRAAEAWRGMLREFDYASLF